MLDIQLNVSRERTDSTPDMEVWEFIVNPDDPRSLQYVVSSVRLWKVNDAHTMLRFWNGGASTGGWLVIRTVDAITITARLFGVSVTEFANSLAANVRQTFRS